MNQEIDPYCNLLAWQFTLATQYGFQKHALEIKEYGDYVKENFSEDIIQFLLCLRNIPKDNSDEFVKDIV